MARQVDAYLQFLWHEETRSFPTSTPAFNLPLLAYKILHLAWVERGSDWQWPFTGPQHFKPSQGLSFHGHLIQSDTLTFRPQHLPQDEDINLLLLGFGCLYAILQGNMQRLFVYFDIICLLVSLKRYMYV